MNMFEICRLNQKQFRLLYNPTQKAFIDNMPKLKGKEWSESLDYSKWKWGDRVKIDKLKEYIKDSLKDSQGMYCAYCGNELNLTSEPQIEHIAPKGKDRYPEFMFHSSNLTLACGLCNGFEKKEKKENFNTIGKLDTNYENCYFNIVHPYLDNPTEHLELGINGKGITISSISLKGQKSIAVFLLDEEIQTNARGKTYREYLLDIDEKYRNAYEEVSKRNTQKV